MARRPAPAARVRRSRPSIRSPMSHERGWPPPPPPPAPRSGASTSSSGMYQSGGRCCICTAGAWAILRRFSETSCRTWSMKRGTRTSPPPALTVCAGVPWRGRRRPSRAVDGRYPRPRTPSLAHAPHIRVARAPVPRTTPRTRPGHPEKTKGVPPREGRSAPRYRASYCVAASTGACTSVMSTTSTGQVTKLRCRAADSTAGASFPQAPDARVRKARRGALDAPLPSPHRRRRSRSSISRVTSWDASSFSAGPLTGAWRGPGLSCPRAARRSGA